MSTDLVQLEDTLPAPHQHVRVRIVRFHREFQVKYTATPMDLLGAGVVDLYMVEKILNQRCGAMLDANGLRFYVGARPKRAAWERGEPLTVQRIARCPEAALTLPGMRELFPDGLPVRESTKAFEKIVECARDAVEVIRGRDFKPRHRPVGRFQRLVEWTAVEGVLYVNWERVALDRVIAQDAR